MKKCKKLLSVILAIVMAFGGIAMSATTVKADSGVDTIRLPLDDIFASGTIATEGAANFYEVKLPSDGWLTVTYQGWDIEDAYYSISNEDMTREYHKNEVFNSSNISPKTSARTLALEAGNYTVKVWGYGKHIGNYKIKASFIAAQNNENSNNNEFSTAQKLNKNQKVTGFLSEDDTVDFYRIDLEKKQTIQIIYTARIEDSYFQIWDKDNIELHKTNIFNASETQPKTYLYEVTLAPGTYYVQIYPYGYDRGRYTLQWKEKIMTKSLSISSNKPNSVVSGTKVKLSVKFNPANTTVKTFEWRSSNSSIAEINSKGNIITRRPGIVKFTVTAMDGSNKFKAYTLIVKPKKVPKPKLSISSYYSKRLYVNFNTQYGSDGYQIQYATDKNFRGAKTKNVTSSSVTLNNLKRNKKYYVRVRAYVKKGKTIYPGLWSSVASKTVK